MFLEVAAIVKQKTKKNVRFLIIGDGELRPQIEKKSVELGLTYSYFITNPKAKTDVLVTSWETEIDQVLAGLNMVLLTSNNEGTPVSLIEAQSARIPVVSTNVGGVEDVVIHGETGFITNVGDVQTFANYVLQLIEDEKLCKKMGNAGYDNVIKRYSKQRLVGDMRNLYLSFLNKKN
jgi:glycosyltransferase involved in cell wall biosynthesis